MEITPQSNTPLLAPHILVIDDDDAIQAILKLSLESEGYQVTSAFSAIEAIDFLKKNPLCFDLIILDLCMPEMNGLQFAEQVKSQKLTEPKAIPIIVSSATTRPFEKEAAANFDYFLPKPFDLNLLFEVCERFTTHSNSH